jgi:hypothetical protein
MALYTLNELKYRNLNEANTRLFSQSIHRNSIFDIFLAHSFHDQAAIRGLYDELLSKGYRVYVDWIIDPQLDRNNVTKESAELIRTRLKNSKSLILAMSVSASLSKWVPWELGYADGHNGNCSLLPISDDNIRREVFDQKEYLKLYPYIKKSNITLNEDIYVVSGQNHYVKLFDNIKYNTKPSYNVKNIY